MLPDLPSAKKRILEILKERSRLTQQSLFGPFRDSRFVNYFEGDEHGIDRPSTGQDVRHFERIEHGFTMSYEEASVLTLPEFLSKWDSTSAELAQKMVRHFIGTIDDACERFHQVVHKQDDEPFEEQVLRSLRSVSWGCDSEGKLELPQALTGDSKTAERIRMAYIQIFNSPELRSRFIAIATQKKREWDDREAGRKLVN